MKFFAIVYLSLSTFIFGQSITVILDSLSTLDDNEFHLELLSSTPKEKLILPKLKSNHIKYFTLFYSWETKNDQNISVLDDQQKDKDILYVDKNNDEDLTDDGDPIVFPVSENKLYIDINAEKDPKQIVRLVIYRIPEFPDSLISKYFDADGNLNSKFAKLYGRMEGIPGFEGKRRTFYCDDRVTLRRGNVTLNGITYAIGLFDYSNNGLYNDDDDLLLIDLNRDGKLKYNDQDEVFKLNDVFNIGDVNYELSYVDKYGRKITLTRTTKKPTNYFLQYMQNQYSKSQQKNIVNKSFWKTIFTTIDGRAIAVKDFKGKYIFINIWGEWCMPCIEEIPELKKGYEHWKNKVIFLSILNTQNISKAKKVISKEKMVWPQIKMDSEIEHKFKVYGYPTNILIYPDGKTYIKEGQINRTFFELNVK